MNKLITKSLIASMPRWVKCLTVDSNGKLWGHEASKADLECNKVRHYCVDMSKREQCFGQGFDRRDWQHRVFAVAHK